MFAAETDFAHCFFVDRVWQGSQPVHTLGFSRPFAMALVEEQRCLTTDTTSLFLTATLTVIGTLVSDILLVVVDPRISFEKKRTA